MSYVVDGLRASQESTDKQLRGKITARPRTIEEEAGTDRSEVCNLRRVVTETFGVLPLCGVTHCYSKIECIIIHFNAAWRTFQ
jgi:hypothetical protein